MLAEAHVAQPQVSQWAPQLRGGMYSVIGGGMGGMPSVMGIGMHSGMGVMPGGMSKGGGIGGAARGGGTGGGMGGSMGSRAGVGNMLLAAPQSLQSQQSQLPQPRQPPQPPQVSRGEPFPEPPLLEVLDDRGEPVDTCILDRAEKDTGPPWLFSVGRQASCDVPIDHPSVGAHHLDVAFTMLGGVLCIKLVPVDHANPTKIKSMVLPPGRRFTVRSQQVFKVGDVSCRIVLPMQPSSPTSALSGGYPFSAEVHRC